MKILLPSPLPQHAWQIERAIRLAAIPLDRRVHPSQWYSSETVFPSGDDLIRLFWESHVPGSRAPEISYVGMVQSLANRGYDVSEAEALLPRGIQLAAQGEPDELRALTAQLLAALHNSPPIHDHLYWQFTHPSTWQEIVNAMDHPHTHPYPGATQDLEEKILSGWQGQLAGGAFGTPIEGYHTRRLQEVYGVIDSYLTQPETVNDDVVYELAFLDAFESKGRQLTSTDIALEWMRQIPFGWSAEWVALRNLNMGIFPPDSGTFRNPFNEWIGGQMRGMVCGMLAPGWPFEAARLAYLDGVVSHAANGVYGEMFAAVLTSLAFVLSDIPSLIAEGLRYLPQQSEYVHLTREILALLQHEPDPPRAWELLDTRFQEYNWIHAYPNLAADLFALWHSGGEMGRAFRWLAHAGLDVDCNAGLVGNILGILSPVAPQWCDPLEDRLDTYLRGKEHLSIHQLAQRTAQLAKR
ncbi:MAG: ADP-ribosylglycohydrolase family protein [Chloroflexota bacterium]